MVEKLWTKRNTHPLFERFSLTYLAEITGYAVSHLSHVRLGNRPATPEFRRTVVAALRDEGITASGRTLFLPNGKESNHARSHARN